MSKSVLVVEDDENSMILFVELLQAKGFETLQAGDGMEGLKLAREHVPDLVIMDIQLPDISGLEVTRKIKEDEKLRDIPIIAVTAYALRGDEEACRKAGCVGYIAKPISINDFNEAVDKHIG
jgi:two-component system cell cycle response regulator DivK